MKSNSALTIQKIPALIAVVALIVMAAFWIHARAKKEAEREFWHVDADREAAALYNQLRSYCQSQTNFPALTAEELHERGIFDDGIMSLLNSPNVHFYPFSSTDPDTNVVFREVGVWPDIHFGNKVWLGSKVPVDITKRDILNTNAPDGGWLDLNTYQ